jgi:PAS domain S-box-containing protein
MNFDPAHRPPNPATGVVSAAGNSFGKFPVSLWQKAVWFSVGYFLCAGANFYLKVPAIPFITLWLPAGLYVAVLLLNERRDWPWLVLAVLPASLAFELWHGTGPGFILFFYFVNTFQAVAGAWLMRRFVAERPTLGTLKEFAGLLGFSAVFSSMLAATMGATMLTTFGLSRSFTQAWMNWWSGDALAILLFTSFILAWFSRPAAGRQPFFGSRKKLLEAVLLAAVSIALTWHLLFVGSGVMSPDKSPLILPLLWAGLRFGPRGATAAGLLVALPVVFFTTQYSAGLTPAQAASGEYVSTMQIALAVGILTALIPAIILHSHHQTMAELKESEETFSKAFQASYSGILICELETGRYIDANESFGRLYGYSRPEMIGRTSLSLGIFQSQEERDRILRPLRAGGSVRDLEMVTHGRHGDRKVLLVSADLIELGGKKCIVALIHDITGRKQAELHIEHLNRVYAVWSDINQTIVRERDPQVMLTATCRIAVEKGKLRMAWIGLADASARRLKLAAHAGATADTLKIVNGLLDAEQDVDGCVFTQHALRTGRHGICNDILHDPQAAHWRAAALEHGYHAMASLPLKRGGKVVGTFNLYAGEQDFFDAEELRLLEELAADISFALEVVEHETKRQQAEQELRWRTAFFEAQVHSAIDGILVVDSQGRKILQNQRMNDLWKIPPPIAADPDDSKQVQFVLGRVKDPRPFAEKVAHLYAHPDETSVDEIELVDGTVLDRYSAPVRGSDGKHYGRVWTFREITERRTLEAQVRQSQKMEAIGQLASGVAHDFNNILAVIQLQADLLRVEESLSPKYRGFAREIGEAAQRAADLTRQLLLFSRKQAMQLRNLDLNDSVLNITKMLQRVLGEDVQMQFKYSPHPLFIHADAGMMDQVLMNLTVNARDAMPQGGKLIIETSAVEFDGLAAAQAPQSRPGAFACLNVSDTGCGIPPENLPQIFNPFFTTKDVGKGTGLGLATVFGIVQQHQGWINVYSEAGQGTTFRIYLPRLAPSAGLKSAPTALTAMRGGQETILLAEDDPSLRLSVRMALSKLGYRILEAPTGVRALEVWQDNRGEIHLLLTDLMMPDGMTGKELAQRILQDQPGLKVIYMSGYSAEVVSQDFPLQEGVNFLAKPFETGKLAKTIRDCLDGGPTSKA